MDEAVGDYEQVSIYPLDDAEREALLEAGGGELPGANDIPAFGTASRELAESLAEEASDAMAKGRGAHAGALRLEIDLFASLRYRGQTFTLELPVDWLDADGQPVRFAISDNVYGEGQPERFCHQMLPTHLSAEAQAACSQMGVLP